MERYYPDFVRLVDKEIEQANKAVWEIMNQPVIEPSKPPKVDRRRTRIQLCKGCGINTKQFSDGCKVCLSRKHVMASRRRRAKERGLASAGEERR